MKPIIINTELYCHKIEITVTGYDPDFNSFKGTMIENCPDAIIEYICDQLAEGNRFGNFESIHEWLSEDIDTYYSGSWEIVKERDEFFKITSVSRGDLEERGFDVSNVSDATMERLARKMADDYCEQLFWESMEIIAESLGIERIEKEE